MDSLRRRLEMIRDDLDSARTHVRQSGRVLQALIATMNDLEEEYRYLRGIPSVFIPYHQLRRRDDINIILSDLQYEYEVLLDHYDAEQTERQYLEDEEARLMQEVDERRHRRAREHSEHYRFQDDRYDPQENHSRRQRDRSHRPRREQPYDRPHDSWSSSSRSSPRPSQSPRPIHVPQQTLTAWRGFVDECFADYSKMQRFPHPPGKSCGDGGCDAGSSTRKNAACVCTMKAIFKAVQGVDLKKERLRWHPDRFSACPAQHREAFKGAAQEIFIVVDELYKESRK